MRAVAAIKVLHSWDMRGKYLYTRADLGLLFDERGQTLRSTIRRLRSDGVLDRVANGMYRYSLTSQRQRWAAHDLAVLLRSGEYVYESLESAASQWGFISQVPLGRLMCVTTGASGLVDCFGDFQIEFVHRDLSADQLRGRTVSREPATSLPIATREASLEDMLTCPDRSVELIDWEEVDDD